MMLDDKDIILYMIGKLAFKHGMSDFDFYGLCTVLNSEIAFEEHLYSALDLAV